MFIASDLQGVHIYFAEHFTNTGKIFYFPEHLPFDMLPKLYRMMMNHSLVTVMLLFLVSNMRNFWCKNFRYLIVITQWDFVSVYLSIWEKSTRREKRNQEPYGKIREWHVVTHINGATQQ